MTPTDRIIRAARELRNVTHNLCLDALVEDADDEPIAAWNELDAALNAADDAALAQARKVTP